MIAASEMASMPNSCTEMQCEVDAKGWQRLPHDVGVSSVAGLAKQVSESPTSAKRSLTFSSPREAAKCSRANVEIDVHIDIAADSTGTTGTTLDYYQGRGSMCSGPSSPTASTASRSLI